MLPAALAGNSISKFTAWIVLVAVVAAAGAGVKASLDDGELQRRVKLLEAKAETEALNQGLLQVDLAILKAGTSRIEADLIRQQTALERVEGKVDNLLMAQRRQ